MTAKKTEPAESMTDENGPCPPLDDQVEAEASDNTLHEEAAADYTADEKDEDA